MYLPHGCRLEEGDGKQNKTISVRASQMVSVFAIDNDFLQGDGFIVLPTVSLGTKYYIASYWNTPRDDSGSPGAICVSALDSDTVISIVTQDGGSCEAGCKIALHAYESYRYDGNDAEDLSGTLVTSDKPVSVVSGVFTEIPQNVDKGDGIIEQMYPVKKWGQSFVLAPFKNKPSGYFYRIFAAENTTTVIISPSNEVVIQPGDFYEGEVQSDSMLTCMTDHPVMIAQYMKGFDADSPGRGDPSLLIVPPTTSYTNEVVFPVFDDTSTDNAHTYFINVISDCSHVDGLFLDDDVPIDNWEKLQTDNKDICVVRNSVSSGVHRVSHTEESAQLSVYVYGICDECGSSYIYAASANLPNATYDECSLELDQCDENAYCIDADNGYTCSCFEGYDGNGFQCEDIDECVSGTHNCDDNAICGNFDGGFNCTCTTGYTGDGMNCKEDIDILVVIIISIAIVVIVVVIMIAVVIVCCCCRRDDKKKPDTQVSHDVEIYDMKASDQQSRQAINNHAYVEEGGGAHPITIVRGTSQRTTVTSAEESKEYELTDMDKITGYMTLVGDDRMISDYEEVVGEDESWEIEWDNLLLGKVILGRGNFGEVREGAVWYGEKAVKVAVKSLKDGASLMERKEFMDEFGMMTRIGRHPNIVALIGACENKGILYVALELIPHGNLRSYLRRLRDHDKEIERILTPEKLLLVAADVANGMKHLEEIKIIHRDIAARNILLGEGFVAKISDFGLSKDEDIYMQTSKTRVPVRWLAPESLMKSTYSTASDVWSYGILLWEIGSLGGTPYATFDSRSIRSIVNNGYRMPKPEHCSSQMYEMMEHCWKHEPESRPTFDDLHRSLCHMLDVKQVYMNVDAMGTRNLAPINQDRDDL